jgi:hypothetical protein
MQPPIYLMGNIDGHQQKELLEFARVRERSHLSYCNRVMYGEEGSYWRTAGML